MALEIDVSQMLIDLSFEIQTRTKEVQELQSKLDVLRAMAEEAYGEVKTARESGPNEIQYDSLDARLDALDSQIAFLSSMGGGGSGGDNESLLRILDTLYPRKTDVEAIEAALKDKAPKTHTHGAGDITSGTLTVSRGGTGRTSLASNKLIYGASSNALETITVSAAGAVFYDSTTGAPKVGTLPINRGGTGTTSLATFKTSLGLGPLAFIENNPLDLKHGGTGGTSAAAAIKNLGLTTSPEWIKLKGTLGGQGVYYTKFLNMVIVRVLSGGTWGTTPNGSTTIATLPAGYRPAVNLAFPFTYEGDDHCGRMAINKTGAITAISASQSKYWGSTAVFPV